MNDSAVTPVLALHRELNPRLEFKPFEHRQRLEAALCGHICERLQQGIEQRGQALLVVSGGRTPVGTVSAAVRAAAGVESGTDHPGG